MYASTFFLSRGKKNSHRVSKHPYSGARTRRASGVMQLHHYFDVNERARESGTKRNDVLEFIGPAHKRQLQRAGLYSLSIDEKCPYQTCQQHVPNAKSDRIDCSREFHATLSWNATHSRSYEHIDEGYERRQNNANCQ